MQSHEHRFVRRAFAGAQSVSVMRERIVVSPAPVTREPHAMLDRGNRGEIICVGCFSPGHCPELERTIVVAEPLAGAREVPDYFVFLRSRFSTCLYLLQCAGEMSRGFTIRVGLESHPPCFAQVAYCFRRKRVRARKMKC